MKLNERGFMLLELIISLAITSIIITGILVIYNQNFSLMHSSIEESDKSSTARLINSEITGAIEYGSVISIENGGNKLVIDAFSAELIGSELLLTTGLETRVLKNVLSDGYSPLFAQPTPYSIQVNYVIEDKHGRKAVSEKIDVFTNKYDKEYFN